MGQEPARRFRNFLRATLRLQEHAIKLYFRYFFTRTAATIALLSLAFVLPASGQQAQQSTALELSKKETVASALLRGLEFQEYEVRSAAEAMPEESYGYHPAEGKVKDQK